VPASASHYEVLSTFKREEIVAGVDTPAGGSRGIRGIGTRPNVSGSNVTVVHTRPGYHGQIWVNPADGTILRVTMDADLTKGAPFRRAAILVEYGPVDIAGSRFICPMRGIALSKALEDPETMTQESGCGAGIRVHAGNITEGREGKRHFSPIAGESERARPGCAGSPRLFCSQGDGQQPIASRSDLTRL
jgi:hypothetical protein